MKSKKLQNWKKGEVIYDIGDNPQSAFLLNSGQVILESSEGIKVGTIKENEIFGEKSCILGINRSVKAISYIDSSAIVISREVLLEEMSKTPVIIKAILRSTYLRLESANLINDKIKDLQNHLE
tara:strand:- start:214 stop:585 length:372 start_codon:yes stop_codon:yes gene_type:complete